MGNSFSCKRCGLRTTTDREIPELSRAFSGGELYKIETVDDQ